MKVEYIRAVIIFLILLTAGLSGLLLAFWEEDEDEERIRGPDPDYNSGPQMMISTSVDNTTNDVTFFIHAFNLMDPNNTWFYLICSWENNTIIIDETEFTVHFRFLGNISIRFWVEDGTGESSDIRNLKLDLSDCSNMYPIAVSSRTNLNYAYYDMPVLLDGEGSFDPDGEVIGYYWDFGDGTHSDTSKGINGYLPSKVVAHTYDKTGLYRAELYVMDNSGNTSKYPFEIYIQIKA